MPQEAERRQARFQQAESGIAQPETSETEERLARFQAEEVAAPPATTAPTVGRLPLENVFGVDILSPQMRAGVASFAEGVVPFLKDLPIPGIKRSLAESKAAFPKTSLVGKIAGSVLPVTGSFKAAALLTSAARPLATSLAKRIAPQILRDTRAARILRASGQAISVGAITDVLFNALQGQVPNARDAAIFAAIDAVIPIGSRFLKIRKALKKVRAGEELTEQETKVLTQDASRKVQQEVQQTLGVKKDIEAAVRTFETPIEAAQSAKKVIPLSTKITETIQNSQVRVEQLEKSQGVRLKGKGVDPVATEILFHGRQDKRLRVMKETVESIDKNVVSLEKRIKKEFTEFKERRPNDDISKFLIARHAPERNLALNKPRAAGISNEEAAKTLKEIDALPYADDIKRIGKEIKDLNDQTLDILLDGQVIDKELHTLLRTTYKNHVGLQRILEGIDDSQVGQILSGPKGITTIGTGLKRAKGSELPVDDILTNVSANVSQAIIRAEKNQVALSTLNFARANPDLGLFKEVIVKPIGTFFPVKGKPARVIYDTDKLFRDQNILGIRESGKQVFLKIEDPMLANAMKMTNKETLGTISRFANIGTRYVTATATRFNPAFQIPNIVRDTQEMVVFLTAQKEFGALAASRTAARIPGSMKDIMNALFFKRDTAGARLYRQMELDGGTTGGLALSTRKSVEINIDAIRKANRSHPRKAIKELTKFFDNYNSVFEDATRLSVYKEAIQRGLTRKEAAVFAKEATINFNRKGIIGSHLNAWYAFSNAAIQGSVKMARALKIPKVAAATVTTVFGAVQAQNMWNDALDPSWRDKVPQWERNNNLVIVLPSKTGGKFNRILLPVSWGLKPIKTIADYALDLSQGINRGTKRDIATGILSASLDALNPIGGSNIRQAITPTIFDLPTDIAVNENWFGKPITIDDPHYPNLSDHKKYFRSLKDTKFGLFSINATRALNDNVGISISPQVFKYTLEQLGGGSARFALQVFDTATEVVGQGNINDVNEIPIINRFFKSTPPDIVEAWKKKSQLNDPSFKRAQEQSDNQAWDRKLKVRDGFNQWQATTDPSTRTTLFRDMANQDPRALKTLMRRIKDKTKGISYFDSELKDLEPEIRADRIIIEMRAAKNKKGRWLELIKGRVVDGPTMIFLRQKNFVAPQNK